MKNAYIERALGLPQREIERQLAKESPDPEFVALMRLIDTIPWLVEVADNGFDPEISKLIMRREATKLQIEQKQKQKEKDRNEVQ